MPRPIVRIACTLALSLGLAFATHAASYQGKRVDGIRGQIHLERRAVLQRGAVTVESPEDGVGQPTWAVAMLLRQLDGLRDGRVRRHTSHIEQLIRAETQQVVHVRIEP